MYDNICICYLCCSIFYVVINDEIDIFIGDEYDCCLFCGIFMFLWMMDKIAVYFYSCFMLIFMMKMIMYYFGYDVFCLIFYVDTDAGNNCCLFFVIFYVELMV